jgi:hypothetical protein
MAGGGHAARLAVKGVDLYQFSLVYEDCPQ